MDIVYVCPGDWPKGQTRVRRQIEALANAGHSVSLVARNYGRDVRREPYGKCHVYRLPSFRSGLLTKLLNFPFFFGPIWLQQIAKVVRMTKADSLVVYDLPMAPAAVWVGKWFGIPVHYDMAEIYPVFIETQWDLKKMSWSDHLVRNPAAARFIERYVLRRIASLSVVSEESMARCAQLGVDPNVISVVGNTPDDLPGLRKEMDFPEEIKNPRDWQRLLFVGILIEDRGLVNIINAMPRILENKPNTNLVIVGDGTQRPELEELVKELEIGGNVEFLGWQEHATLGRFYQHCDVGVIPFSDTAHIRLTIANKLCDYMAAGLPIIASDVPPMRRILTETGAGVLVPPDQPEALAVAVIEMLEDRERMSEFSTRGTAAVDTKYNWETDAAEFVKGVEAAVARSR